jgi:nicotinate phosphoribosyltransferase
VIVLSNQLDELVIWQIITQIKEEAARYSLDADAVIRRLVYGVGTNLITSEGHPALDGVYKLVAVEDKGAWLPAIKISESPAKTINPGSKRVWRLYDKRSKAIADLITLDDEAPSEMTKIKLRHPTEDAKLRLVESAGLSEIEPLLVTIFDQGKSVYKFPEIDAMRHARNTDLERLDPGVKRIINPHTYHVSLSQRLWSLKQDLIFKNTNGNGA